MKLRWKGVVSAALFFLFVGCGNNEGNKLITMEGVGNLTFDQEVPNMGKGYTVVADAMYFDDNQDDPYFVVEDKSGNPVARVFSGQAVEVFSPEFRTEAGIHPDMKLYEAAKIAGEDNLYIWLAWPETYFMIDDCTNGFSWKVEGRLLIGGDEKFQQISQSGTPATLADFLPDARISSITVYKQRE